jgi:hypothetical protein
VHTDFASHRSSAVWLNPSPSSERVVPKHWNEATAAHHHDRGTDARFGPHKRFQIVILRIPKKQRTTHNLHEKTPLNNPLFGLEDQVIMPADDSNRRLALLVPRESLREG